MVTDNHSVNGCLQEKREIEKGKPITIWQE